MGINGLDWQLFDVKFTQGLDTKTQRKLVIPGKWDKLENATLSDDNTPERRDGIVSITPSYGGNGLSVLNNELLIINGDGVRSVGSDSSITPVGTPVTGQYGFINVTSKDVAFPGGAQQQTDCAYGGGITCYAWMDITAGTYTVSLLDEATGDVFISGFVVATGITAVCIRVVFSFDSFFIFYVVGAVLYCRVVQLSSPSVMGAQTSVINSASFSPISFDAIDFGRGGNAASAMVVYGWLDGVTSVRSIRIGQTAGVPSVADGPNNIFTEVQLPAANLIGLAIVAFSSTVAGIFTEATGAFARSGTAGRTIDIHGAPISATVSLDGAVSATAAPTHITGVMVGGNITLFWDKASEWGTAAFVPILTMTVNSALGSVAPAVTLANSSTFSIGAGVPSGPSGPWIYGKAFATGGRPFLPVRIYENYVVAGLGANVRTNSEQNVLFILDGQTGTAGAVLGQALYGSLGAYLGVLDVGTPCSVPEVASGVFALAAVKNTALSLFNGQNNTKTGITRLTLTPNFTKSPIDCQLGSVTYLAGGSLTSYTPGAVVEHGFSLFPEGISVTNVGAGGALTAGVHQVVAVYEWYDNAGNRHQSAPSLAVSATSALNDHLTVVTPTLQLSQKAGINIVLYMTQAAGTSFYRAVVVANSLVARSVTVSITSSDVVIGANELLYTQPDQAGTTLPNFIPGPCLSLAAHQNRIFKDESDVPNAYRYSQQYVQDIGLQFNEELGGSIDVSGGGIVGFASLDEKVIILAARKLFVIYGTGPNAAGGFNNYSDPQEVPSDVGCSEARSILRIPQGVIFKSKKGWHLLGRDLTVQYIGDGVEAFNGNDVTSAVMVEDKQECRFYSTSGTYLIFAYQAGQWSTAKMTGHDYSVRDAVWWPANNYVASVSLTDGLNQDTPGVFLDAPGVQTAAPITVTARTSWLHMRALNGFQRTRWAYLSGTYGSSMADSALTVLVDYDYAYSGAPGAYSFTVPSTAALRQFVGAPFSMRSKLRRQKCEALAFTFIDVPTVDNPAGVSLQAVTLEVGVKRGIGKLPAAQNVG